jgi:hypothetical protein
MNPRKRANTFMGSYAQCGLLLGLAACSYLSAQPIAVEPRKPLTAVHKICVGPIAGEESAVGVARELAISALFASKYFTVTERCEKADATLKGAAMERSENRVRAEGEAAGFGVAHGHAQADRSSGTAGFGSAHGGSSESLYSAETRTTASVTLRLVDPDGTVIWAYTQDSVGGKTKGAVPDAVERAVKQLVRDIERAQNAPAPPPAK